MMTFGFFGLQDALLDIIQIDEKLLLVAPSKYIGNVCKKQIANRKFFLFELILCAKQIKFFSVSGEWRYYRKFTHNFDYPYQVNMTKDFTKLTNSDLALPIFFFFD